MAHGVGRLPGPLECELELHGEVGDAAVVCANGACTCALSALSIRPPHTALGCPRARVFPSRRRYTFEDLAAVVEYARQRGVRVVPEFDTPGHAGSICTGYPDACPSPTCTMPVNPASNTTLPLINAVLAEISALTPDTYFHLGGDEVDTRCVCVLAVPSSSFGLPVLPPRRLSCAC